MSKLRSFRLYHFHGTSDVAKVKQLGELQNNWYLLPDASNLAAFLYRLQQTHRDRYDLILRTVQLDSEDISEPIAPFGVRVRLRYFAFAGFSPSASLHPCHHRFFQLGQGFVFDLPDAFAG